MKKLLFLLVLVNGFTFSQLRPGIDYMPQIAFFDFVVNYLSNPNWTVDPGQIKKSHDEQNWYFDQLSDLGLTNLVSDGQYHRTTLQHTLDNFYIHDMGFAWKHDLSLNPPRYFLPARSMNSLGHQELKYVIELGGESRVSTISELHNFGFGVTASQASTTSKWVLELGSGQPIGVNSTGINGFDTLFGIHSRIALTQYHTPGGAIMWAKLPTAQFPLKDSLKIRILFRRGQAPSSSVTLFTINATSVQGEPRPGYNFEGRRDHRNPEIEPETIPPSFAQEVTAGDLINDHLTNYAWFESNPILIAGNKEFEFNIIWSGNADLFIDKIMVYNTSYGELYVDFTVPAANGKSQLLTTYPPASIDSFFQSFYFDEPFQLSAQYRGDIQKFIKDHYQSANQNFEVNSAVGGTPKHLLDFDKKYANYDEEEGTYKKYLLYNMYPIVSNTTTLTASLQPRLDLFINYNNVDDTWGTHHDPDKYKYVGILPAILAAKEANIPLISTICVAAEQYVKNTGSNLSLEDGPHRRRPPTPDEIKVMGNISLAYGAKGFMYYMVPTRAGLPLEGQTVLSQYGLFEEADKAFDPSKPDTWVQNPANLQVPNERYDAVQSFISSTSLIAPTLLRLRWLGADGWSRNDQSGVTWIKSCSTSTSPDFSANSNDADKYVETGYFDEDPNLAGYNQHAKYIYVVNRRCNWQGTDTSNRFIRFKIDSTVASHCSNIIVTNLKTGQKYYTTKNSNFDLYLKAGDGTLLKFEPRFVHGGTLVVDEFISEGIYEVDTTLIVPDGVKLTVSSGAKLTFRNSGRLLVEDGELEVNGTLNNKVEFDFVSKNWGAGNGIHAYRTPLKIKNAVIKNASCGIYSHISPGDTIDGVTVDNTHYGISLYYSYNYGADNTVIRNSQITNSQLSGIAMVGSRPVIHDNTFQNASRIGNGVNAFTNSEPWLIKSNIEHGNNKFENLNTSIYSLYSTPVLGSYNEWEYWGKNCFIDDSLSLHLVANEEGDQTTIYAFGNFWQSEKPEEFRIAIDGNYEVLYEGFTSVCSGEQNKMAKNKGGSTNKTNSIESDSIKTVFNRINDLLNTGELRQARELINGLISGETSTSCKKKAVRLLPRTYYESEIQDLITGLLRIRQTGNLFKATTMLLMNIDTENMATYKQEILNAGNNKMNGAGDNSELVMTIYNNLLEEKYNPGGVIDTAGKVAPLLAYLNGNHPGSEYTKMANLLFSELPEGNPANKPMGKQHPGGSKPETVVYEYNLYNTYPNPFNPETVIKFSLKEKSSITLMVYSITGQKVVELASGEMEKGLYEKRFNGTKFSSGVYIFRLEAQSLESKTTYSKTMKALLLK